MHHDSDRSRITDLIQSIPRGTHLRVLDRVGNQSFGFNLESFTGKLRPYLQAGRVTLVTVTQARGLPWHSHISCYFQRRIYKAARVTLTLG